jgi:lactate 2-monooxygenase
VVTLDTTFLGWRVRDLEHAFLPFLYGMGLAQYVSDPVFNRLLAEEPPMSAYKPKPNLKLVASLWKMAQRYPGSTWRNFLSRVPLQAIRKFIEIYMNPSLQWDDLARLRKMTKLPLILKGIQHPDDARKAVDLGVEGIFVSNHGGRQIDGAIGSLDALYNVKRAVGDQVTILFDSGIRSGSDAFKALALGAHAIGIGRPYAYGLGINGMSGVQDVIEALRADFELTMALTGCKTIGEISSQNVAGPILRD